MRKHLVKTLLSSAIAVAYGATTQAAVLTLQPDDGKDAQVANGGQADSNFGSYDNLITNWGGNLRSIGLVEFDLSALPAGASIVSATLSLFHSSNACPDCRYDVFRVTSAWEESTVTFNSAPTFDSTAAASLIIGDGSSNVFRDWDVTSLVAAWASGAFANHGLWVEEIPVQGDAIAYFDSSDSSAGLEPRLTIEYADASTGELVFNPKGVGHIQYVPYFSTQEGNVTAISIVNTDTVNGKVLKVRFRGASNSDDVYDFQVFLSPGDVWTAGISQGSDGKSRLDTADKSCTLPANVNGAFISSRTPAAGGVAETREGYIEILTMADIVQGASGSDQRALYTATKHVKGVAPCTTSVLSALTYENAADYMAPPTTGLMANWSIINVNRIVAYSGAAAAIEARDAAGEPGPGRLVYWDQRSIPLSPAEANANTADPLLRGATPAIAGARYDLPDLSTPYLPDLPTCPFCQARALSDAITAQEIASEFYNEAWARRPTW